MKYINSAHIYCICYIGLLFLELLSTRDVVKYLAERHTIHETYIGYQYLLIFTKLLLLFDAQYFASFIILKKVNAIVQLRATKILVVLTWIFLGIRLHFYSSIICYLILKFFTFFYLSVVLNDFSDIIYHQYNMQISTDIDIINNYIIRDLIIACKKAIKYCLILLILTSWSIDTFDLYSIYSYIKFIFVVFDNYLSRFKKDDTKLLNLSVICFCILCIFGIIYMIILTIRKDLMDNIAYLYNEILLVILVILLLYKRMYLLTEKN